MSLSSESDVSEEVCPGENTFLALVDGRLEGVQRDEIAAHLRGCDECQEIFAEVVRPTPLAVGRTFGRYVARRLIGAGGMGLVYEGFDPLLSRRVALKLIRTAFEKGSADAEDLRSRLLREAKALARLNHPNVVAVYDIGEEDGLFFIAMELVEGTTLGRWLPQRADRTWKDVLDVYLASGRGLAAAHDAGVVHRDFKPSNVLVAADGRRVFVTDFGLARMIGMPASPAMTSLDAAAMKAEVFTRDGALMGSPAYMSPEQLGGKHADVRSDIFSFCVSLWSGLYGVRPFEGTTVDELKTSIAAQVLPSPAASDVPVRIRETVARGLRESPDERPHTMHALIEELERQSAHEGLTRAERIMREADAFFPESEKVRAVPALAVSLLEDTLGQRLRPPSPTHAKRPDLPDLAALEVSGRPMRRFMEMIGDYESILSHFMARAGVGADPDGIVRFAPDKWYLYSSALDFTRSEPFGPELAHRLGFTYARAVLETEKVPNDLPFDISSLRRIDQAFNQCLRLRGMTLDRIRRDSSSGEWTYIDRGPGVIEVTTGGAAQCATSRGYWTAIAKYFGWPDDDIEHCEGPCRERGGAVCRYLLRSGGVRRDISDNPSL
jgi:serine/threonine protein kinase